MSFIRNSVNAEDLLRSLETDAKATVHIKEAKPREGTKWRQGIGYLYTSFSILGEKERAPPKALLVYARGMKIVRQPTNADDPNDYGRAYIKDTNPKERNFDVSGNSTGAYGKLVKLYNAERNARIEEMSKKGELVGWTGKKFNQMYRTHISSEAEIKAEYRGKPYKDADGNDDFRLGLTVDFSLNGADEKVPVDRSGKPKTIVRDFRTGRLNEETGNIEYDIAMVDGKPVDETNAYKFLTVGSTVEEIYIDICKTSKSQQGISNKQFVTEIVVTPKEQETVIAKKPNADLLEKLRKLQENKSDGKTEVKTETKTEVKPETNTEVKTESKQEVEPQEKKSTPSEQSNSIDADQLLKDI